MLHSLINTHSRLNLQVVSLTFHDFNLEAHSQCRYDYVAVYNGLDENSPLQGRYCGASVPAAIRGTSNELYVVFVSDHSVQHAGFRASYSAKDPLSKPFIC